MSSLVESGSVWLDSDFLPDATALFEQLAATIPWDERMKARKVASFGEPYNYSGIIWPKTEFPPLIEAIRLSVSKRLGYETNNCLAHYYPDGNSNMGFHGDATDDLAEHTGISIVSLGAERNISFRPVGDRNHREDYRLSNGSLFYMCPEMQTQWKHAILPDEKTQGGRISLTFRRVKTVAA